MSENALLINLVLALAAAGIGAAIAVRLGQSAILGYILAGLAIGPFTPGFVGDIFAVQSLAEIGIILLMFAIGVQLSFRDLLAVGRVAIIGGTAQVGAMIAIGYLVGTALGWPWIQSLFFGAVISNSSSTVLTKVLDERGELGSEHGRISLAWSSIQDLGTVVLVVVLGALATGDGDVWPRLLMAIGMAALFIILLVPLGTVAFRWLFERVAELKNREVFILTVAAVALGAAYVSSLFGLSLALGAFIAGIVVGESDLSYHILGEITPLRDVFVGLFFVSVGMLVNPVLVFENLPVVLLALALIVLAKGVISAAIVALSGYPVRTVVLTGATLGQSAEFSFLLASLGAGLGAIVPAAFSLILAAVVLSIVLAPSLQGLGERLSSWLERRLPEPSLARAPEAGLGVEEELRGHAVICGYGRVGSVIGSALAKRGFRFVAIDGDVRRVRALRAGGIRALLGDAGNPVLLDRAGVSRARVLVVALPDFLAARRVVTYAKQSNAKLNIVVRTHSGSEFESMQEAGVREAVNGELELALEMTRHTLSRFGIGLIETQAIIQGLRERIGADDDRLK